MIIYIDIIYKIVKSFIFLKYNKSKIDPTFYYTCVLYVYLEAIFFNNIH